MRASPLGPRKRVYVALAALCLLASGLVQWRLDRARRKAFGPPRTDLKMVELWPVLLGGFRGPVLAGLAYYAGQKEVEADIYATRSALRAVIELQPEFHHLWIYYGWVVSYNLSAVLSSPAEKYTFIRDGADFVETGIDRTAEIYEGQKPFVNERCPMTGDPLESGTVAPECLRRWEVLLTAREDSEDSPDRLHRQTVAFSSEQAALEWERLTDAEKGARVEAVRGGSLEFKRKRATLLFMTGWTYYQKLSDGEDATKYYRPWFIRDTGKDPYRVAYTFLAWASALDVPPYQVSYHVLKTAPVHCLQDHARALANDESVPTRVVLKAFDLAENGWEEALPFIEEKKRIMHSVREIEQIRRAMRLLAVAEEKAAAGNDRQADAALLGAERQIQQFEHEQPDALSGTIYRRRLDWARKRVDASLNREPASPRAD